MTGFSIDSGLCQRVLGTFVLLLVSLPTLAQPSAPTGIEVKYGPSAISMKATRIDSLTDHRAFRMHFYLKLDSKANWDDQTSPGGSPGGNDSPIQENSTTDTAVWTSLTPNTVYDIRVRVAAYSDVLNSNGDPTGWVYSGWEERQVTTGAGATVPAPTVDQLRSGQTAVAFRVKRTDSLAQHRAFRMHFYLKLDSKAAWDDQTSPGGSPGGNDSPKQENSTTDTAVWTSLTPNTAYDVRVRVAVYSDVLDSNGNATGWVYSDWVERQISTGTGESIAVPVPMDIRLGSGLTSVSMTATRTNSLAQHRAFRMHFYLKLDSKSDWDDQTSPGGDPGGSDNPKKESGTTDAAVWTGLTSSTTYDVRVRVAAYSDVLDSNGDPTGWVYSDWVERKVTTARPPPPIPVPTGIELKVGPTAIQMTATRVRSLRSHRAFRMHFYLKPASKDHWDSQASPGGDPGGSDRPVKETGPIDTAVWAGLAANTTYDVRVRVAAYIDQYAGWGYSPWIERQVTTSTGLDLPTMPVTIMEGNSGSYEIALITAPTADVSVSVTSDSADLTLDSDADQPGDQNSLSFTPEDWSVPQIVTLTAAEDSDLFSATVTLTHTALSADANFDIADAGSVTVTVSDNDACPNTMDAELLSDCKALLDARDDLQGTASLNWSPGADISEWEGVTVGANNRVTKLVLKAKGLNGTIPAALGNLSMLEELRFHENQLTGSVPPELGRLTSLTILWLSGNQLTGNLPTDLGALFRLRDLRIYENNLTGAIPFELGRLTDLTTLRLSGNQFTGEIPSALGDLINLKILRLHGNRLTGSIPPALGGLANIERLYLNDNELDGTIPPDLGNLTNLQRLYLFNNNLTSSIPSELGNLKMLPKGGLRLNGNRLSGCIPASLASHKSHIADQQNDVDLATCAPGLEQSAASFSVVENSTTVGVVVNHPGPANGVLSFVLTGADAQLFSISQPNEESSAGELTFLEAPDYEQPRSTAGDNTYVLTVMVNSGSETDETPIAKQHVRVMVVDVYESPGPQAATLLPDLTLEIGSEAERLDLGGAFSHSNGEVLTFAHRLDRDGIVAVIGDAVLTITAISRGTATLTVEATDASGLSAYQTVSLTVTDTGLRKSAERSLAGFGRSMIASVSAQIGTRLNGREAGREPKRNSDSSWSRSIRDNSALTNDDSHLAPNVRDSGALSEYSKPKIDWPTVGAPNPRQLPQDSTPSGLDRTLSLLPSNFALKLSNRRGIGALTLWGARDRQSWNGEGHDGDQTSLYLGLESRVQPNWMMGVSVVRNGADSRFRHGWASREMDLTLTTVLPYVSYRTPDNRTSLWVSGGVGSGTLDSAVLGAASSSTSLEMSLYMAGGRHSLAHLGGLEIALTGDLALADLETPDDEGAQSLDAGVSRVRAGLNLSWAWQFADSLSVTPTGELSVRQDSGDESAGTGLEFSGGVRLTKGNFHLAAQGRTLAVHSEKHYSESGFSLLATFAPGESGKGLTASLGSHWGASTMDTGMMWGEGIMKTAGTGVDESDPSVKWTGRLGYGFLGLSDRYLLTPFVDTNLSESRIQGIQTGARIERLARDRIFLDMDLALGARARGNTGMNGEVSFKVQARF